MSFDFGISATQSALNNWQNNEFQQEANKKERQFQWEMSQYEYENAVEMWNRTNVYNSPVEQRKRLEAAGLNPALMYGKGASPGIASPAPSIDAPDQGNFGRGMGITNSSNGMQGILNAYNDLRQTSADVAIKSEQAELLRNQNSLWSKNSAESMAGVITEYELRRKLAENGVKISDAELRKAVAVANSAESKAYFDQERQKLYSEEGIFLDQLTNVGKKLEKELGSTAAVIIDAIFGKIKSR